MFGEFSNLSEVSIWNVHLLKFTSKRSRKKIGNHVFALLSIAFFTFESVYICNMYASLIKYKAKVQHTYVISISCYLLLQRKTKHKLIYFEATITEFKSVNHHRLFKIIYNSPFVMQLCIGALLMQQLNMDHNTFPSCNSLLKVTMSPRYTGKCPILNFWP